MNDYKTKPKKKCQRELFLAMERLFVNTRFFIYKNNFIRTRGSDLGTRAIALLFRTIEIYKQSQAQNKFTGSYKKTSVLDER